MLEPTCRMNKWLNNQNKLYRSWEVIEFCSWQVFDLKSFCQRKLRLNFKNLKFEFSKRPQMKKTIKMKIVGLKKLWNFVINNILVWTHLVMQNFIWILKFKFLMISDGKPTKIKVIDFEMSCNFIIDNFFIWNHIVIKNRFEVFKF
jgi:hypothetical protein